MKRRSFIQTLAVTPAVALPAVGEVTTTPSEQSARQAEDTSKLEITALDAAGETVTRYFSATQFATLRKLSGILTPPLNNLPGALEAGAPEFLDFLISKSPVDRQQLYKVGLDTLNAQALKQFKTSFAELNEMQAATLLAPLRKPWTYDPPTDSLENFLQAAKQDVRTATQNSRTYIVASSSGGRRGGGMGQYWYPID